MYQPMEEGTFSVQEGTNRLVRHFALMCASWMAIIYLMSRFQLKQMRASRTDVGTNTPQSTVERATDAPQWIIAERAASAPRRTTEQATSMHSLRARTVGTTAAPQGTPEDMTESSPFGESEQIVDAPQRTENRATNTPLQGAAHVTTATSPQGAVEVATNTSPQGL